MIDDRKQNSIEQVAKMFLGDNPEQSRHYSLEDLVNETVLVLLEGYRGNKLEGDTKFAVYAAAERLSRVECQEMTGHDFISDEGSSPSGRRNTEDDYVSQLEVDDWMDSKLDDTQHFIVKSLLEGRTQFEIGQSLRIAQQTVSDRIAEIQELVKEDFDVN